MFKLLVAYLFCIRIRLFSSNYCCDDDGKSVYSCELQDQGQPQDQDQEHDADNEHDVDQMYDMHASHFAWHSRILTPCFSFHSVYVLVYCRRCSFFLCGY